MRMMPATQTLYIISQFDTYSSIGPVDDATHKLPSRKMPIIPIFLDIGNWSLNSHGIGNNRTTKSVTMLVAVIP